MSKANAPTPILVYSILPKLIIMRLKFLMAFLLFVSTTNSQVSFQKTFPAIDRYVDSLSKDWNLPGLALGIVYKDQLIYSKGYGFRNLEEKLPVQTNTLFPIASNSKLFTATLAAMLAEEGKMNLDKPVRSYMPSLNFYNDDLNARISMRDMLSHRTGLPRYDFIWVGNEGSRKDAVSKVMYMKPQLGLREGYIYNNMMYASAGLVMETIMGKTWEDLTREKISLPLEMKASVFDYNEMRKSGNYSLSYFLPDTTRNLLPK